MSPLCGALRHGAGDPLGVVRSKKLIITQKTRSDPCSLNLRKHCLTPIASAAESRPTVLHALRIAYASFLPISSVIEDQPALGNLVSSRASTPGQVAVAEWQVPITLPSDLEDGISNAGLHRGGAVVTHAAQPMPGLEEGDVDFRRILFDARQRESVEIVLHNVAFGDKPQETGRAGTEKRAGPPFGLKGSGNRSLRLHIPILVALPLHSNARRIPDLDPS